MGKEINIVVTRNDNNGYVHLWFLGEDYRPMEDMPSIPINEGVYKDYLRLDNFVFSKLKLEANDKWDGKFETMDDFEKFKFNIKDIQFYQISDDDGITPKNIHEAIVEGEFWDTVEYIAKEEKIFE